MSAPTTVYVVDDEDAIRRSLRLLLAVQGYAVTQFSSGGPLLEAVGVLEPGALLLDMRMPEMDGLEVMAELAVRGFELPTVIMTGHGDTSTALAALRSGAVAFLEKPFTGATVKEALDLALLKLNDPHAYAEAVTREVAKLDGLDPVDREVLAQLASGRSNEGISAALALEIAGLEFSRARILSGLGVATLNDALRVAYAAGYGGH